MILDSQIPKFLALNILTLTGLSVFGQNLSGLALTHALQHGGYVIVMRHGESPMQPPSQGDADSGNTKMERQLDGAGKASAKEMGDAIRDHHIPIGKVLSSPTFRALETVQYTQLGHAETFAELGDNGMSMSGPSQAQTEWLRQRVGQFPSGSNTLIVTHNPNLVAAFADKAVGMKDGEALVFGPGPDGKPALMARIRIDEWKALPE